MVGHFIFMIRKGAPVRLRARVGKIVVGPVVETNIVRHFGTRRLGPRISLGAGELEDSVLIVTVGDFSDAVGRISVLCEVLRKQLAVKK